MAENEATENEAEGSNKKPLILFIVIALLLVGGSVGGTLFFLGFFDGPEEDPAVAEDVVQPAMYFALMTKYKTNVGQGLLRVGISLMTREQEVIDALSKHSPSIKSKLAILLSGQDFTALQTLEGREELRAQCLKAVQGILKKEIGKPGVEEVLFTDYVMQL